MADDKRRIAKSKLSDALAAAFPEVVEDAERRVAEGNARRERSRLARTVASGDGTPPLGPYRVAQVPTTNGYINRSRPERAATLSPIDRKASAQLLGSGESEADTLTVRPHWKAPPVPRATRPATIEDLCGRTAGRMTVIGFHNVYAGDGLWLLRCACGDFELRRGNFVVECHDPDHCCELCSRLLVAKRGARKSTPESRLAQAVMLDDIAAGKSASVEGRYTDLTNMSHSDRVERLQRLGQPTQDHWTVLPESPKRPEATPDQVGRVSGRLRVIAYWAPKNPRGSAWVVQCECGDYEVRRIQTLKKSIGDQCTLCHLERQLASGRKA